ncbi:MAG: hypothetical protein ACXWQO_12120 [Bdellovibrionota bacterium]
MSCSRPILALLALSVSGGLLYGWNACGQVEAPFFRVPAATETPQVKKKKAKPSAALAGSNTFNFRPVDRAEGLNFDEAERVLSRKSFLEEVYDKDMEQNFRDHYRNEVEPYEKTANNPLRRARSWEMKDYDDKRSDMAKWASREIINDQIKEFFRHGDKNAAPMQVMGTLKDLSNGGAEKAEDKPLTPEEKLARAHRQDLPQVTKVEEEKIPTKLKTKLNIMRRTGTLLFTNPIVTTTVNVKSGNRDDNVVVEMNREFHQLTLNSRLRYEVDRSIMNFNLNKKITDRISLDMEHMQWTGSQRSDTGEKKNETAKLLYSVGF